jgi:ATP-dependent DNA helicase RecG
MESQDIEYKETWRDEYLKWIGGFANAQGGKIYIGIKDNGEVIGIDNAKQLMEEIPNKTRDVLGILVDVNLKTKTKKQYLEIVVEGYPTPISFKGQYFYRSGSTKQELKGPALDMFILRKQGRRWDSVPLPYYTAKDIYSKAIAYLKQNAIDTKRINSAFLKLNATMLLEKLNLKADAVYFKRACALLFHANPEKYITGAFIKIGFFDATEELLFQDDVHGCLFEQVEKIMELLLTKYLKAYITYEVIQRVENYPVPVPALREAVLNAVVHKDYSSNVPIQISVYDNKIIIWNTGQLPENWTIARLKTQHSSSPYNPDVANGFFFAGLIETWGQGTIKIINECIAAKIKAPVFKASSTEFCITFNFKKVVPPKVIKSDSVNKNNSDKVLALLLTDGTITIAALAKKVKVSDRTIKRILKDLQEGGKIKRSGSDKAGAWEIS